MKVLFVCVGNAARSQVAAAYFAQLSKHEVLSAGTRVGYKDGQILRDRFAEFEDQNISDLLLNIMLGEGMDLSGNVRRQLTAEMASVADKVIVMAELETLPEYLRDNAKMVYWDVTDPFRTTVDFVPGVVMDIKRRVAGLVAEIG